MIWIGIGLIIIGLALFGLVGVLIKPLTKLSSTLDDVKQTTSELPETINGIKTQVDEGLETGIDTLQQLNTQLKELTPIFYLVGDVGRTTQQLSSKMVTTVEDFEERESPSFASRKNLEGLYGATTLAIMIFQKAKEFSQERKVVDSQ